MIHGLDGRRFAHDNRSAAAAPPLAEGASAAYRAWRKLTPDSRLAAVERKLRTINLSDGYPAAL